MESTFVPIFGTQANFPISLPARCGALCRRLSATLCGVCRTDGNTSIYQPSRFPMEMMACLWAWWAAGGGWLYNFLVNALQLKYESTTTRMSNDARSLQYVFLMCFLLLLLLAHNICGMPETEHNCKSSATGRNIDHTDCKPPSDTFCRGGCP